MKSSPWTVPHKEVAMAFWVRAQHSNISHRSQQSVPEEFSAPLELLQPLSGLVDGRVVFLSPPPPSIAGALRGPLGLSPTSTPRLPLESWL
jgi:hypothetical protein